MVLLWLQNSHNISSQPLFTEMRTTVISNQKIISIKDPSETHSLKKKCPYCAGQIREGSSHKKIAYLFYSHLDD